MRTKSRLLDILPTVNPELYPNASMWLEMAAGEIAGTQTRMAVTPDMMHWLTRHHESEYIRELASEALHYLDGA